MNNLINFLTAGILAAAPLLFGVLGETLTARESAGCAIMFAAILLSQLGDVALTRLRARRAQHSGLSG